jgi:hypothetical protein
LKSVQRLRQQARALGNLKPTPRQRVIVDPDDVIVIAPPEAEPDVVYIPVYDPMMVFYEPPPPSGFWITFDVGFPLGVWIGTGISWSVWHVVYGGWGYDWGWGSVYGGCCRGAVYSYTPTSFNRRLHIDHTRYWRPRHFDDRRRAPFVRRPAPPRPSADDISRGRITPRTTTAPRPDIHTFTRPPTGFSNIQRRPITERNVQRGRESLNRTLPFRRPEARTPTPPTRFAPPTTRAPEWRDRFIAPGAPTPGPSFTPRMYRSSPSFTPRPQSETHKFTTRGLESRSMMKPPGAPNSFREAPKPSAPPKSSAPPRGPGDKPDGKKR